MAELEELESIDTNKEWDMTENQKTRILWKINDVLRDIARLMMDSSCWKEEQAKRNEGGSMLYVLNCMGYEVEYNENGTEAIDIKKR